MQNNLLLPNYRTNYGIFCSPPKGCKNIFWSDVSIDRTTMFICVFQNSYKWFKKSDVIIHSSLPMLWIWFGLCQGTEITHGNIAVLITKHQWQWQKTGNESSCFKPHVLMAHLAISTHSLIKVFAAPITSSHDILPILFMTDKIWLASLSGKSKCSVLFSLLMLNRESDSILFVKLC